MEGCFRGDCNCRYLVDSYHCCVGRNCHWAWEAVPVEEVVATLLLLSCCRDVVTVEGGGQVKSSGGLRNEFLVPR